MIAKVEMGILQKTRGQFCHTVANNGMRLLQETHLLIADSGESLRVPT